MGHASSVSWSKFGAFLSPYVVVSPLSPFALGVILGVVNVIAAFAAHLLPETGGRFLGNYELEVSSSNAKGVAMVAFNNKYDLMPSEDELSTHNKGGLHHHHHINILHVSGSDLALVSEESP